MLIMSRGLKVYVSSLCSCGKRCCSHGCVACQSE